MPLEPRFGLSYFDRARSWTCSGTNAGNHKACQDLALVLSVHFRRLADRHLRPYSVAAGPAASPVGCAGGVSLPSPDTVGILLIFVFAVKLAWLPSFGRGDVVHIGWWSTERSMSRTLRHSCCRSPLALTDRPVALVAHWCGDLEVLGPTHPLHAVAKRTYLSFLRLQHHDPWQRSSGEIVSSRVLIAFSVVRSVRVPVAGTGVRTNHPGLRQHRYAR